MVNQIVVTCPVCAYEVIATPAGAGLVVASHLVPGTRFPCPEGGTMVTSPIVGKWRGVRAPQAQGAAPVCSLATAAASA